MPAASNHPHPDTADADTVAGADAPPVPHTPANFLALPPRQAALNTAAAVLIPVPIDSTTSYRSGARYGPAAIIAASAALEDYDLELNIDVAELGIHTTAPLEPDVASPRRMVQRVQTAVAHYQQLDKLTGVLGGDHSAAIGSALAALQRHPAMSVLYIDAHADLRAEYQGARWGHASAARRIAEHCPLTLAGVRTLALEERDYITAAAVPVTYWPPDRADYIDDIIATLANPVYLSIDLDALDPSEMAAVGTPEPGGMRWLELLSLLRAVARRRRIIGFDLCELAPNDGPPANAYTAAKLTYKIIAYAAAPQA